MIRDYIDILAFGGASTSDANQANGMQTVPRKRRPRARGEIFITSESKIYLNEASGTEKKQLTDPECDPIYENTSNDCEVKHCQSNEIYENLKPGYKLNVCTVRLKMYVGDTNEVQQVAAFFDGKKGLQ